MTLRGRYWGLGFGGMDGFGGHDAFGWEGGSGNGASGWARARGTMPRGTPPRGSGVRSRGTTLRGDRVTTPQMGVGFGSWHDALKGMWHDASGWGDGGSGRNTSEARCIGVRVGAMDLGTTLQGGSEGGARGTMPQGCLCLDSIHQDFAFITTLALIDICRCAKSLGNSTKQIQQDMEENYASSIERDFWKVEEVAEKCLKHLMHRSLISIYHSSFDGKIERCGMHLTCEFYLREAAADVIPPMLLPPPHAFPQNLKKLTLELIDDACIEEEWVVEEEFPHLKFLYIDSIPQDFSNIMTLHELIDILYCPKSSWNSAKKIQQDMQEEYAKIIENSKQIVNHIYQLEQVWLCLQNLKGLNGDSSNNQEISRTECPNSQVARTSSKESLRQRLPTPHLYMHHMLVALPQQEVEILYTTCGTPHYVAPEIKAAEFSCLIWFSPVATSLIRKVIDPNPQTGRVGGLNAWRLKAGQGASGHCTRGEAQGLEAQDSAGGLEAQDGAGGLEARHNS
ncbi:hypothetical protein H5410_045574 [Solanum commersonii]|uniref:Uncharacterized protein n=1 Tax=Solanum commersonii TaxID=4109 RepID=A0A9J5XD52_SOLCO|nr:hypothetical protein H5410_045574 [Solanum commersonii]